MTGPFGERAEVRAATRMDVEPVSSLLHSGFGETLSQDTWRLLFDYAWCEERPNFGFVLVARDKVVGFLGAIYTERERDDRIEKFCNLTSWYVDPDYRSSSLLLLFAVLAQSGYTITDLTATDQVGRLLERVGFKVLDTHKLVCAPWLAGSLLGEGVVSRALGLLRFHYARRIVENFTFKVLGACNLVFLGLVRSRLPLVRVRILSDTEQIDPLLEDEDRRILRDHLPYGCSNFLVADGSRYAYLIAKRRRLNFKRPYMSRFTVSEILYMKDPELALRHWQPLWWTIMWHDRSHALVADERIFGPQPPSGQRIECKSFFYDGGNDPRGIDNLYSEIVLLSPDIWV